MWFLQVGIEYSRRKVRGAKLIKYLESHLMALKVFVWWCKLWSVIYIVLCVKIHDRVWCRLRVVLWWGFFISLLCILLQGGCHHAYLTLLGTTGKKYVANGISWYQMNLIQSDTLFTHLYCWMCTTSFKTKFPFDDKVSFRWICTLEFPTIFLLSFVYYYTCILKNKNR